MKKTFVLFYILLFPAFLLSANRDSGTFSLIGYGGFGKTNKPVFIKDYYKSALGYGGTFQCNINDNTALSISYTCLPFKINKDKFVEEAMNYAQPGFEDVDIDIQARDGGFKASFFSANWIKYFNPPYSSAGYYLALGGGYYMIKREDATVNGTVTVGTHPVSIPEVHIDGNGSENKFGLNGGLGIEINVGESVSIVIEGKYHYVFTKDEEQEEIGGSETSGKFQFLTVMGGIRIGLGGI